ncbi:hypothetical protein ASPACDRAFT_41511 [Aspergillus aculeatus ATCC 16872]|uniref:DUF7730 domain-containing protein n=1 Tax=Aspergillus aculeatus (strain ATCC 16872 / CBS 172.66 / WB 5094) TaxID=690307 RepID=A0A1L9WYV5_ASPA1|nr:uncharacterized protein ASPACDRAFT_41511 [Aspergillus aculeatus ATCC 16872]OJK01246.1 hypothetical protein ASPACDRAFT_41511 [Aspergillus aculeatus ATCC 16872]
MDSPRPSPKPTLLTLPLELRQIIYTYLFTTQPITIQKKPISAQCSIDNRPLPHHNPEAIITTTPTPNTNPTHDLKTIAHLDSPGYPSPTTLDKSHYQPSYALLLTNRQLHHETQHLAYSAPLFRTQETKAFANFTSCLTRPQIQTIRHLAFLLPLSQGMETHAAEWHETFALVRHACPHLRSVSVEMALAFPAASGKDTYWDGGLLELDWVRTLRGMRVIVYSGDVAEVEQQEPFFLYEAGTLHPAVSNIPNKSAAAAAAANAAGTGAGIGVGTGTGTGTTTADQPISFHHARDALRRRLALSHPSPDGNEDNSGRLFFRTSPNVFPLYVRNLTEMLLRRRRSHAEIRGEDRMQRNEIYYYVYLNERPSERDRVFGFQYGRSVKLEEWEFERALEGLRRSRERLRVRRENGELGAWTRPERVAVRERHGLRQVQSGEGTGFGIEKPGAWRRQLLLEASAPFIESFPDCIARPYRSEGRGSG